MTVNGNGAYGSGDFTPTAAGTYRWIANYSGDANNAATANACNDANESVVVNPAHPTVVTQASAAVTIGGAISDTGHARRRRQPDRHASPSTLYGPNDATCTGAAIFTSTVTVNGNGAYGSGNFTPTATGTYRWIANYGGDVNNTATANGCNGANESVVVKPATPDDRHRGDRGRRRRRQDLRYGHPERCLPADDRHGHLQPLQRDRSRVAKTLRSSPAPSRSAPTARRPRVTFTVTLAGTYHWIASYSGDANNDAVAGVCGDDGETTVINKFNPDITTSLSSGDLDGAKITVLFGASVTDQATLRAPARTRAAR